MDTKKCLYCVYLSDGDSDDMEKPSSIAMSYPDRPTTTVYVAAEDIEEAVRKAELHTEKKTQSANKMGGEFLA